MSEYRYIPLDQPYRGRGYHFRVEMVAASNGRWYVWIPSLPGCTILAYTKGEALDLLRHAARVYIEEHLIRGCPVLDDIETIDAPVITVTV